MISELLVLATISSTVADVGSCEDWQAQALNDAKRLLAQHGANISLLQPFGAEVRGLRVAELVRAGRLRHSSQFAAALERLMAHVGLLVFREQGIMSAAEQIAASTLFGAGQLHSTHA